MLKSFSSLRLALAAPVAALVLASSAAAQEQPERTYSLSESVSEALGSGYKTAADAKNYDAALAVLDAQLAKVVDKTSYDAAVLLQIKAQTLLQKNEYGRSIEPLEQCLQLSDTHTPAYFDERISQELTFYLAQLYFQEATTTKNATLVVSYYDKSEKYMTRWVKNTKKPTVDALLFYSSLLYNRAIQDADHPDTQTIARALEVVDKALHLTAHPKDNLYVLKLVCLQQLNRNSEATELLELLVKQKPENKTYWTQLAALYLNQQQDIRAIVTFERAQANGFMNAPKDNFNLVGIHFNLGQYSRAAELLEKGLKDGSIDNEQKNWELLAYSYQQLNRDLKAIDVLKEATKVFPKDGQLEYQIAQNYYGLEKLPEALTHIQACATKGGGHKPHQAYLFLAYIAFELKKFDIALEAAKKAMTYPDGAKEAKRMLSAIEDAIKDREAKMNKM
ncbi:MAG: hypothetical protein HYV95_10825 [Opitutae bacterium]|nr:hypothetical protein [Opitutae bacterium]